MEYPDDWYHMMNRGRSKSDGSIVVTVKSRDAKDFMKRLAREEGLFVGISSGANVLAALKVSEAIESDLPANEVRGKTIVTILPDSGERYLSMNIF